jgi:hypothetical protein
MAKNTVPVQIAQGKGDASVTIFNHIVSFKNYFPKSGTWALSLTSGQYAVSVARIRPAGGTVDINITGISGSNPAMPFSLQI